MAKLWEKNYRLDGLIESFTVGRDYLLDQALVPADCCASLAHGTGLLKLGILAPREFEALKQGLLTILAEHSQGRFVIRREEEDCHTAIENRLCQLAGEAGKKIHTGRSRNDQVLTALRLFGRASVIRIRQWGEALALTLIAFAETHRDLPMPGRTHLQIAMPSSVGLWAAAWAEDILDGLRHLAQVYDVFNQCPLGAAASYGVRLPLDRELTAGLLGFARPQNNVLYAINSRGRLEALVVSALDHIGLTLSCAAQDLILFSLPEFGYFELPRELCSGSSIMPQKKNPDGLELLRAKSSTLSACLSQIRSLSRALPSGYNRDFQETKEPFLKALDLAGQCLRVMDLTFARLKPCRKALEGAFTPEIFATDAALEKVLEGTSFREAYREVGLALETLTLRDPAEALKSRTALGTPGNLNLDYARGTVRELAAASAKDGEALNRAMEALTGRPVDLLAAP
ncbi:MAG: argininosuccinate lyase [Spirochaetales bacterium]|jgi:argininosuccinate lyase|nr:argininosuccinate lyase [Spirochaetales bacterium]